MPRPNAERARTTIAVIPIVQRIVVLVVILICCPPLLMPIVLLQRREFLPLDLLPHVVIEDAHLGRAGPLARGPLHHADVTHGATTLRAGPLVRVFLARGVGGLLCCASGFATLSSDFTISTSRNSYLVMSRRACKIQSIVQFLLPGCQHERARTGLPPCTLHGVRTVRLYRES